MMKTYELVLFDFDGTLVDTVADIAFYANSVLVDEGFLSHAVGEVKNAIGLGVHELLKCLEPSLGLSSERLDRAVTRFKQAYREKPVRKTRPYPGVAKALSGPLGGTPKAIITNKPQDITLQILRELGMEHHFEHVIGMHAGYPPKPDPIAMETVIKKMKQKKNSVVYIGDSRVDSETCLNAGVDFVWMDYGYDQLTSEKYLHRFSAAEDWIKLIA